jgi:steroid 5-alpha reductase family enzyme
MGAELALPRQGDEGMEVIEAIFGAVALIIVTLAVILGLIIFVLILARWALRLWVELYRRWQASIRDLRSVPHNEDHVFKGRHGR